MRTHGGDLYGYGGGMLDFSVNLNPLGMPAGVLSALTADASVFERYPDTACRALKQAIAGMEGVDAGQVVCGNGASDLIYRLCLALWPGRVLVTAPAFSDYERAARQSGAQVLYHALEESRDFRLTGAVLTAMENIDVTFVCSPNNPNGLLADPALLEAMARRAEETGGLLVIDECFLPLSDGDSFVPLLGKYPRTAVLRAFTKTFAMAGLRLGYLLTADPRIAGRIENIGQAWPVSGPAQAAGIAACGERDYLERSRSFIRKERAALAAGLGRLGLPAYPGDSVFLLFRARTGLVPLLVRQGLLLRCCADYRGLDGTFYRAAVRRPEENARLLDTLEHL